jgi:hypothetical protein
MCPRRTQCAADGLVSCLVQEGVGHHGGWCVCFHWQGAFLLLSVFEVVMCGCVRVCMLFQHCSHPCCVRVGVSG